MEKPLTKNFRPDGEAVASRATMSVPAAIRASARRYDGARGSH